MSSKVNLGSNANIVILISKIRGHTSSHLFKLMDTNQKYSIIITCNSEL